MEASACELKYWGRKIAIIPKNISFYQLNKVIIYREFTVFDIKIDHDRGLFISIILMTMDINILNSLKLLV